MVAAGQAMELDLHHGILPPVGRIRPEHRAPVRRRGAGGRIAVPRAVPAGPGAARRRAPGVRLGLRRPAARLAGHRRVVPPPALVGPRRAPGARRARTPARNGKAAAPRRASLPQLVRHAWLRCAGRRRRRRGVRALRPRHRRDGQPGARTHERPGWMRLGRRRTAALLLEARSHWLRMPPWLLAYHTASKGVRSLAQRATKREGTATG